MIFTSEKVRLLQKHMKKHLHQGNPYLGGSRRATSLMPTPMHSGDFMLKGASFSGYSNLLLSLEADQKSGCIIIQSKKNKARSGILMFRGRILGCMHGQKNRGNYSFGDLGYKQSLKDLQSSGKTVDVYGLKEEIVIAAGALFHGPTKDAQGIPALAFFEDAMVELIESNVPGCIVISDKTDAAVCTVVYVFAGQIAGIHSNKGGWLQPDFATVEKLLQTIKNPSVQSCFMPCYNVAEVDKYSFSLSGLGDRDFSKADISDRYYMPNIFSLWRLDDARLRGAITDAININKFIPYIGQHENNYLKRMASVGRFYIHSASAR